MPGSLNLKGNLGRWSATTGLNNLGTSQSQMSVTGFLKVLSITPTLTSVFGMTLGPLSNAFGCNIGGTNVTFFIRGVNGLAAASATVVIGQTIFFSMTLNATGNAQVLINGEVKNTKINPGITVAGPNSVYVGINTSGSASVLLAQLAVWNDTVLSISTQRDIRDGLLTPLNTPVPATSYWFLGGGTPGASPVAADAAMHDLIGTNHFITMPGPGGNAANAAYDATDLVYQSSIAIITPYVSRAGSLAAMPIGSNPAFGTSAPSNVTGVNADPGFSINGTPVSVVRMWSDVNHILPFVFYQFYDPADRTNPIIVSPTDDITYIAPSNWVQTRLGFAAAESGSLANYSGSYEPGLWGYLPFDSSLITKTYEPCYGGGGVRSTDNGPLQVLHRSSLPWSGALTSDSTGYPLTVAPGGTASSVAWSNAGLSNSISPGGFPLPWGDWYLTGDEHLIGNPCTPTLTCNAPSLLSGPTVIPGDIVGGVELHKRFKWTVTRGTATSFVNAVSIAVKAPAELTDITLKNMVLTQGGDTPVDVLTTTNDVSNNLLATYSSGGVAIPYSRFLYGAYPNSSWCRPTDLVQPGFVQRAVPSKNVGTWENDDPPYTLSRWVKIYAVEEYDLTLNPKVYSDTQWNTTPGNSRFVPSDSPASGDFMMTPADFGLPPTWMYNSPTNQVVCQFVCADEDGVPFNHELRSGQFINISQFTAPCANEAGSGTCNIGGFRDIWVTAPNKFIAVFGSNLSQSTTAGLIVGTNLAPITAKGSLVINDTLPNITVGQIGAQSSAAGNPGIAVTINHALSDSGVTEFAQQLYDSTARGTKIHIQWSNEIFINNNITAFLNGLSSLIGYGYGSKVQPVIQRQYEVQNIFKSVWGSDSSSIICIWQPWTVSPQETFDALTYAQTYAIPIDEIAIAPYIDMDISNTFTMAAASIVADLADSIAYPANGGAGIVFPMVGYVDLVRHYFKYNTSWNGPNSLYAQQLAQIAATGYGGGGGPMSFVYPPPVLTMYEGGISTMIPPGVSHTKKVVRAGLSHDFMYGPWMYDAVTVLIQHYQQPGPTGTQGFASGSWTTNISPRSFGFTQYICTDGPDNISVQLWGNGGTFQGQPAGYGLSNKFWAQTPQFGGDGLSHDIDNEIVARQAIFDWLAGTSPPTNPHFFISPISVPIGLSTLNLIGVDTTWTNSSIVTVTNSLSGTTNVVAGTFTAISNVSAILDITTSSDIGTWKLTIDGVDSPIISTSSSTIISWWLLRRPA